MNFLDACKKTARRCGVSNTPPTVVGQSGDLGLVVEWVQEAYVEVCGKWLNWKFLWSQHSLQTVDGQSAYPKPGDLSIWNHSTIRIDGQLMEVLEYESVKDSWSPSANRGRSSLALIMPDNSLKLDPVPDGAYELTADYQRIASVPAENTDQFLIPEEHQQVIIGRAMMLYAGYENAPEVKQDGLEIYEIAMAQLEAHQLPNTGNRNGVTEGSMDITVVPV